MAITIDVITKVVESSLKGSSDTIDKHFTKSGQQAGEKFSRALAEGAAKSPELQRALDKAADATGKLRVEQEKLNAVNEKSTSTNAQKIAQAERLERAKREEARAVSAAAEAYDKYSVSAANGVDRINRGAAATMGILSNLTAGTRLGGLTADLSSMATGFTSAGAAAGSFGASFAASGLIVGGAVVVGLAAATAGVVELGNRLYDLGSEWDSTFDSIQVKTGATGDMLAQIKQSVTDVAGDIPQSLSTIGDIASAVTTNFKLVGPAAEELIIALGHMKTMGFDVDVRGLGVAFRALNVETGDYQEVLEQLVNLQQTTGININEATNSIEANAGALKAFGFTTGEVITLMREFNEAGLSPDKGLGALNKAFKALTDAGLEPTKASLQAVFSEIEGFISSGQTEKANKELNDLFGPKGGGLTWLELIKDGSLNLNDLASAAEAPRTSIQGLADDTYDLGEQWDMFVNETKTALAPLADEVFNFANEGLGAILDWIKEHKAEIIDFFIGVGDVTIDVLSGIQGFVGSTLKDFGMILELAGKIVGAMATFDEFLNNIPGMGNNDEEIQKLRALQDSIEGISGSLQGTGQAIVEGRSKWDEIKDKWQAAGDAAKTAADKTQENADSTQNAADAASAAAKATDDYAKSIDDLNKTGGVLIGGVPMPGSGPVTNNPFGVPGMHKFSASGAFTGNSHGSHQQITSLVPIAKSMGLEFASGADNHPLDNGFHPRGMAGDFSNQSAMGPNTPEMTAFANAMLDYAPYIRELIYSGSPYNIYKGQLVPAIDQPGSPYNTKQAGYHGDHVHIAVEDSMAQAFMSALGVGGSGGMRKFGPGGMQAGRFSSSITSQGGMMNFGPDGSPSPLPPGTPSPIAGLDAGPVGSTFGYNEYGEPGYYRPSQDSIKSADKAAEKANERVAKAQERIDKINEDIAAKEAERTALNSKKTDDDIKRLQEQLKDAQAAKKDAEDDATDARERADDARRGRFTPARESRRGGGQSGGGLGEVGAPLADDFGISEGFPGIAKWITTFLANLAFAPMVGALSAFTGGQSPQQTGSGLIGALFGGGGGGSAGGAGGSMYPSTPSVGGGGAGSPGGIIGALAAPMGGTPQGAAAPAAGVGGALGNVLHAGTGAPPGRGPGTPQTSRAPSAGPGGGGFAGLGGAPMGLASSAIQLGALAIDSQAPGAGQAAAAAAQVGIQLANRTAGYIGQAAAIGVGGLMETFLPHDSEIADPTKSWFGRIAAGLAGARPALPNAAGGGEAPPENQGENPAGQPQPPQTPEEAQKLAQQQNGGQGNSGPMVNVETMNNYTADGGQSVANQIGRMQMASYASGGPR